MKTIKCKPTGFSTKYYLTYEDFFGSVAILRSCRICGAKQYRSIDGKLTFNGKLRMKLVCQNKHCRVKFI